MTINIYPYLLKNSLEVISKLENDLFKAMQIVERASNESCCLCRDECLSCDAKDLLREMNEK
jgi:hypothetical protein